MKYVELYYPNLHVSFDYGDTDWETGRGKKEFDQYIEYTYKIDQDSVEEVILNLIPEDEYQEIDPHDEVDAAYEYIEANFDKLFERFEHEILDYFEQDASEEAARNIDPDDYDSFDEGLEMNESVDNNWSKDLQDKLDFLKNHETYEGKFSRGVKIWDLGLTPEQEDYFGDFLESGFLEMFWDANKELAKDIYQEGRQGGHLVLDVDYGEAPLEYDPFNFRVDDVDEAFELWCNNEYGLYSHEYAYTDEEMAKLKQEFVDWFNSAYDTVVDFDDRAEKLVDLFKQNLDNFIEREKAPSEDLTETMFSEVEDIKEPELDKPEHDEINESYFDPAAKYLVVDVSGNYLNDFEDADEAIGWAEANWKAFEVQEITDDSTITIWRRNGFPDGDEDNFDECYDDASDELPELEESIDFNPDFDDDFAGHHYTSYDLYRAQQEEEEKEYSDEEAFEERDPNRYDDEHAKEWMKRHPHGWYNSESDYGVGDEENEEEELEEAWERPHHKFENYSLQDKYGRQIANTLSEEAALEYVEEDDITGEVQKIVRLFPDSTKDTIVWVREKGRVNIPYNESWNPYDEEDDEGEPFEPYYVVIGTTGHWIGDFDFQDDAIEFAKQNEKAIRVDKQTHYGPKTIWARKEKIAEKLSDKAEAISSKLHKIYYNTIDSLRDPEDGKVPHEDVQKVLDAVDKAYEPHQGDPDWDAAYEDVYKTIYNFDESLELNESYFDYNKYKLPRDVIKFIKEIAEKDIKERLRFSDQDWSTMDSQDTSDWVMDRIEIKFPGWKWTDENMSYIETVVDDIFDDMRKKSFNEEVEDEYDYESYYSIRDKHGWAIGAVEDKKRAIKQAQNDPRAEKVVFINLPNNAKVVWERRNGRIKEGVMSDLDLDIQEAGDKDALITKLEYNVKKLRQEIYFLTKQAPREIGKGGAFDSQEEIDDALKATERALNRAELKLGILRGNK